MLRGAAPPAIGVCACAGPGPPAAEGAAAPESEEGGGGDAPFVRGGASFLPAAPGLGGALAAAPGAPGAEGGGLAAFIVLGGREREAAAAPAEKPLAANPLGTTPCECVETLSRAEGQPCSTAPVVAAIAEFVEETGAGKAETGPEAVRSAARALGCSSEACVLAHPDFREFAEEAGGLAGPRLDAELLLRFKPPGPRNSTRLLSNYNLDDVLQQWAIAFPTFFNLPFCMIDFASTGGSLARVDLAGVLEGVEPQALSGGVTVRRPCETFACALNTDVSTGRGKHWVAVFGDCRGRGPWTVEYFNSAGNPPPAAVVRWMEGARARLEGHRRAHPQKYGAGPVASTPVTDVRHQDSQTECGLYILFYIRARLEGRPASDFGGARIPDDAMETFRTHVFREDD